MSTTNLSLQEGDSPAPLRANLEDARRFLAAIAPEGNITFQTLCTNKKLLEKSPRAAWSLNRMRHGALGENCSSLVSLNQRGACVFFMVNSGDGAGRSAANVQSARAVFVDLDGAPLEPVLAAAIRPSITVQSSNGRFHAYWLVKNMPLRDFKPAQQALAARFNGDPAICDTSRLMRLPGFIHQKNGPACVSRLITCDSSHVLNWPDFAEAMGLPRSMSLPETIPEGQRNNTLFKLAAVSCKQGVPKEQRLQSLLKVNIERCSPPLEEDEVRGIVERAYKSGPSGTLQIPLTLLSDQSFISLGWGEKLLLLLSYQRAVSRREAEFALPWHDFKQHFPRESTFGTFRKRIVNAGLLKLTRNPTKPKNGEKAKAGLYKVCVPVTATAIGATDA